MIKHTHAQHPSGTLVAYSDNAAVIEGAQGGATATRRAEACIAATTSTPTSS